MTNKQKRKVVCEFIIDKADDHFINMTFVLMKEYVQILKPMSEKEFLNRNSKSQKDIRQGKLVNQKDVKKRFASRISLEMPRMKTIK